MECRYCKEGAVAYEVLFDKEKINVCARHKTLGESLGVTEFEAITDGK